MKLKLGIVGPSGCGKTLIANILGNEMSMDNSIGRPPYRPTNSVRIVEFSMPSVDLRKYSSEVDVQIWEIGGNPRLKSIWPGVQINMDGIILVYDTNNELHVRDMSALHMHFVTHSSLNPAQCLIIGNQFRGQREVGPAKIVGVGPRVRHFAVNVDDDPNYLREEFRHYLTGVAQVATDQEKLPNNSMNPSYMYPPKMSREVEGDGPHTKMIKPEPLKRRFLFTQETLSNDDNEGDPYTHPMYYEHASNKQNGFHTARTRPYNGDNDSSLSITASMEALRTSDQNHFPCAAGNPFVNRISSTGSRRMARDEFSIHHRKSSKSNETSRI